MDFIEEIIKICQPEIQVEKDLIEIPPDSNLGDFALPCFKFAKQLRKPPVKIAEELAQKLKPNKKVTAIKNVGSYVNFFVSKPLLIKTVLKQILTEKEYYGTSKEGMGKTIVIDFSSPNIAKPFGIAHIRSTVIGNSIYKIYTTLGYKVWRINHLGDWGTQFGKLMVAYRKWGNKTRLEKDGINYLVEIYIEFGIKAKDNPKLEEEARAAFKDLEDKVPEAVALWKQFRDLSVTEFKKYYQELGIEFDHYHGEAFYNDQLDSTIEYVQSKVPTQLSEGALIVDLNSKGIQTPVLLRKSDEASTYHTRDIAAALYRLRTFNPDKIIYVVGTPQKLHFEQLFAVLGLIGEDLSKFVHVNFGNMTYAGMMMSTRAGNFVRLADVIQKSKELAMKYIQEKNPDLHNKEDIANKIGIGAIIFEDLSNERTRDVDFTWERALNFEGETAPYLQYTHARICSIQRKANIPLNPKVSFTVLKDPFEFDLIKLLGNFLRIIQEAARVFKPHLIANYLISVAQMFNKFYTRCRVIGEEPKLQDARLALIECVRLVLAKGLDLLGIQAPEEM